MIKEQFEEFAQQAYDLLPDVLRIKMDNVQIVIEDYPTPDQLRSVRARSHLDLLGLYEGIPLSRRGPWYGSSPTVPDRISLFQKNIERECRNEKDIPQKILDVLIHEIAHHFGMNEEEIRKAGY